MIGNQLRQRTREARNIFGVSPPHRSRSEAIFRRTKPVVVDANALIIPLDACTNTMFLNDRSLAVAFNETL